MAPDTFFVKVVTGLDGLPLCYNYGVNINNKLKNTETCLSDIEYISITIYSTSEWQDYIEHINDLKSLSAVLCKL